MFSNKITATHLIGAVIFIVAGAVLAFHLRHSGEVNTISLILLAITLSPLLAVLIEKVSFGNNSIVFRVSQNEAMIEDLKFVMRHFLTFDELAVLYKLSKGKEVVLRPKDWSYQYDKFRLLKLRELGFVTTPAHHGFGAIERSDKSEIDARPHFPVTDRGREFLQRRERVVGTVDLPT